MSYIKETFIESLMLELDLVKIVQDYCPDLKKRGANYFCKSPFSNEKTGSFCIPPGGERFQDFSSGKSGNAVTFIMEKEGYNYPEAIHWLARFAGREVEYENKEWAEKKQKEKSKKEEYYPILNGAFELYKKAFEASNDNYKHLYNLALIEYISKNYQKSMASC